MTELVSQEMLERVTDHFDPQTDDLSDIRSAVLIAAPLIAEEVKERCAQFVEAHTMGRSGGVTTAIYRSARREALAAAIRNLNVTKGE